MDEFLIFVSMQLTPPVTDIPSITCIPQPLHHLFMKKETRHE
jgi:hypothetical protein